MHCECMFIGSFSVGTQFRKGSYLITRHLLSCKINGENVEYLQAYLEITGSWDDSFMKRLMLD